MTTDIFNSRLLDLVQRKYKGAYHAKLIEALGILQSTGSISQACSAIFRRSDFPVSVPSTLVGFGKGNVSEDYLTLLYIDDMLAQAFDLIKNEQYEQALELLNRNAGEGYRSIFNENLTPPKPKPYPDNRTEYEKIAPVMLGGKNPPTEEEIRDYQRFEMEKDKYYIDARINESDRKNKSQREISFRYEIFKGLTQFCQIKLGIPFAETFLTLSNVPFAINNIDDLSFCAICGLFDRYLNSEDLIGQSLFNIEFRIGNYDISPFASERKTQVLKTNEYYASHFKNNNVPMSRDILNAMKNREGVYPYHFDQFLKFNDDFIIKDPKGHLNLSLSNLLSSSSFLWDQEVCISSENIKSMTPDQRLLLLIQNKTAIIEKTFDYLRDAALNRNRSLSVQEKEKMEDLAQNTQDAKASMTKVALKIEQILQEVQSERSRYKKFETAKVQARSSLEEIAKGMGQNSMESLLAMLNYVEKGQEIPQLDFELSGFDQLIIQLLNQYRHNFLQSAIFKERYQEKQENLILLNEKLKSHFSGFTNSLSETSLEDQIFGKRFLEAYTVFSFILFNEEIFPDTPWTIYREKEGAKRLLKLFKKDKQAIASQSLQKWKDQTFGSIQSVLDGKLDKIFSSYQPSIGQGTTIKILSEQEIQSIGNVSASIKEQAQNGNNQSIERFNRLSKILENLLIKDQTFLGSIDQITTRVSPDKLASLQAHMNACLFLAEGGESSIATGLPPSTGFKRLYEGILYAISDDRIKTSSLKEVSDLYETVENFSIPNLSIEPFEKAIKKTITTTQAQNLASLTLQMEPVPKDEETLQMGAALNRIRPYLIEELSKYEGKGEFLSKKVSKKAIKPWSFQRLKRELKSIGLTENDIRMVQSVYKEKNFNPKDIEEAVIQFVAANEVETGILNIPSWLDSIFDRQGYELLHLTAAYQRLNNLYQSRVAAIESKKSFRIIPRGEGDPLKQTNIFENQTLIKWSDQELRSGSNNQILTFEAHKQFLPIFMASFLSDVNNNLNLGKEFFMSKKVELLKNVPEAAQTLAMLKVMLHGKETQLQDLARYIQRSQEQEEMFSKPWIENTYTYIKRSFGTAIQDAVGYIKEAVAVSAILTVGLMWAGFKPMQAATLGCLGSAAWMEKVGPVVKDFYRTIEEVFNYFFSNNYTHQGVNQYILNMIDLLFKSEIALISSHKFNDLRHRLNFTLFLQEEFSLLRDIKSDLSALPNRINHLAPYAAKHMNFSSMAMNLFYMFNKELFILLPDALLKGSSSSRFIPAIKEFIFHYKQLIQSKMAAYQGSPEDKNLAYGGISPFKRQLMKDADQGKLTLSFPRGSFVYQFFQEFKGNITEDALILNIDGHQIVPIDQINLHVQAHNLAQFLKLADQLLNEEKGFMNKLSELLRQFKASSTPLTPDLEDKSLQTLVSSYDIMRHCFSLAERLYLSSSLSTSTMSPEDEWLRGTGETAQSILTSKSFRDSINPLRKTALFSAASNISEGNIALQILDQMEHSVQNFLARGILTLPKFEDFQGIVNFLQQASSQLATNPQVLLPALVEYDNNQGLVLPQVILNYAMTVVNRETDGNGRVVIQGNYKSKFLYLTNGDSEIFFIDPSARGFALSPAVIEALKSTFRTNQNQNLVAYLGIVGQRQQEILRVEGSVPSFIRQMQQFLRNPMQNFQNLFGQSQPVTTTTTTTPQIGYAEEEAIPEVPREQFVPPGSSYILPYGVKGLSNIEERRMPAYEIERRRQSRQAYQDYVDRLYPPQEAQPNLQGQPQATANPSSSQPIQQTVPTQTPRQSQQEQGQNIFFMPQAQTQQTQIPVQQEQVPIQQEQIVAPPQEQIASTTPNQTRNVVQVGADGSSSTVAGGSVEPQDPNDEIEGSEELNQAWREFRRRTAAVDERSRRLNLTPNFLGEGNALPYESPQAGYEPVIENPSSSWGKTAAIGGGLLLGAALLSQMMKKDKKEK